MRIFLTGGGGMVGQNFLENASAEHHEIFAPRRGELDLRDYRAVLACLTEYRPEVVVHAAGKVGGIQANIREPVSFLLENLDIGRNVVWAARQSEVPYLLNLGSSCMYPRDAANPLKEEAILKGELEPTNEGYALAKITVARLCEYIMREDPSFQYKTLIPCNLYGRHDRFDARYSHMVPAIIHKLHEAKKSGAETVDIWGDGQARREFMYAGDLAECMWRSLEHFESLPPLMNVGVGSDRTVDEYYHEAAQVIGYHGEFLHDLSKPIGMEQKLTSVEKASKWGWHAPTSLSEGLRLTYRFYLEKSVE